MTTRLFWLLGVLVLALGCSVRRGPGPGSVDPGDPCEMASDCGCWSCDCEGVDGLPGGAQLCEDGVCPLGETACEEVCAIRDAKVAKVTAVDTCPAVP